MEYLKIDAVLVDVVVPIRHLERDARQLFA
jgi:hypothetical protein